MRIAPFLTAALLASSSVVSAQVESPVPFDSAGQVMAITPSVAQRLRLTAPAWPVVGDFREARVFLAGAERFVLVVERADGARERFPLSATEYEALRGVVSATSLGGRAPTRASQPAPRMGEAPVSSRSPPASATIDENGETSRSAFTARMMLASAAIYGPAAAVIVGEPAGGTAAYLGVVSASFFASYAATRGGGVTRAQSMMASDMAIRGAGAGWLLADALNSDDSKERATGIFLVGLGSTVAGYQLAKRLSVAEVSATTFGSTAAGLTALGILAGTGSLENSDYSRNDAAPILAAGIAGLPLGLWYQRAAYHNITSGDVAAIGVIGALGALTGVTIATRFADVTERQGALAMTAGFVGGLVAGNFVLASRYDHTRPEGFLLGLGTIAGTLAGAAPFIIADNELSSSRWLVGATLGGMLGAWGTTVLSAPAPGTTRIAFLAPVERRTGRVTLQPMNAAFAAARVKGTFPLATLSF